MGEDSESGALCTVEQQKNKIQNRKQVHLHIIQFLHKQQIVWYVDKDTFQLYLLILLCEPVHQEQATAPGKMMLEIH